MQKYLEDDMPYFANDLIKLSLLNVISAPEYDKYVNLFQSQNIKNFDEAIWNIISKSDWIF